MRGRLPVSPGENYEYTCSDVLARQRCELVRHYES